MTKEVQINPNERAVLEILAEAYAPEEWGAYGFKGLSQTTKLDVKIVRRACRSLARKGLSVYERTLWNDDGPAGAGYRASEQGAALISPCDICGKLATYDYEVDENGKPSYDDQDGRHVRECETHYKQSAERKIAKQEALL
jgi:hypothetical protein